VAAIGREYAALGWELARQLALRGSPAQRLVSAVAGGALRRPEHAMFFDIETTGLASTPLFLIGTMVWADGELVARQYFARDYSEEAAILRLFADALDDRALLVSFNGKSFDLPYVRARAAANRLPLRSEPAHLDLLHVCRRAWGNRLPDCRLQTLESCICGRVRREDIPGQDIPDAYHAFVRTGNAAEIAVILRHNLLDLATLGELLLRLPPGL